MKKNISLVLSFIIIFTTVFNLYPMCISAADLPINFNEACDILDIAEVIPKELNTYNLEVSRGDFAVFAGHLLNIIEYDKMTEQYYYDVPIGHWAGNSINVLAKMGVLTPGPDKMFRPDDIITYEEACKVVLSILKYDLYAQERGGYPAGYVSITSRLELNKGVTTNGNMTLADAIMLLYNASLTPDAEQVAFGDHIEYSPAHGKSLLSIYKNIDILEGQLLGNAGTYVNDVFIPRGKVMIDDVLYDYTGENCDDFLGCKVRAYMTDDGTESKVLYFATDLGYSQIRTVDINEYYFGYNPSKREIAVIDEETDKEKFFVIDDLAIILKNKQQITQRNISDVFNINNGSIDMVDIDSDNDYDYVLINDYTDYVVGYIDLTNEVIIDKYNTQKSIDLTADVDKIVNIIGADGMPTDFSAITVGSVLTVFESEYLINVVISNKLISGVIERYIAEDDKAYINETWYEFTDDVLENTILIGSSYILYLDAYSKVTAIEKRKSDSNLLGYIVDFADSDNIFDRLKLKVFDENGTMGVYTFDSSVEIDGVDCETDAEIKIALANGADTISGQLIVFSADDKGLLQTIDTIHPSNPVDENTLTKTANRALTDYRYNSKTFGKTIIANDNTVFFGIPETNPTDDDYTILNLSYFTSGESYTIEAYKVKNDYGFEDAIICYGDVSKPVNDETDLFLVDEIMHGLNDENKPVEIIEGYLGGEKKTVTTKSGYSLQNNGVASGDVIRLVLTFKGEVIGYEMIYDYSNPNTEKLSGWYSVNQYYEQFNMLFNVIRAYPYSNSAGVLKVDYEGDGTVDEVSASANTKIVVYDSSLMGSHARKGNLSDISDYVSTGSFSVRPAIIRAKYASYIWMIIYK